VARERRRPAPRQRPRRRRVPAGEPLLWGAAPCASCAVRVLRTEQRDGQVYVFRGPGDAGCQRVSHFCGALRRARPAPCASCARHWSRSLAGAGSSPGACTALAEPGTRIVQARDPRTTEMSMRMRLCKTPISSSSLSLSFLSLSQCRRAHTHTLIYTHAHTGGRRVKAPVGRYVCVSLVGFFCRAL